MAKGALNPADKARKEARKKELKKNKKQRQQVRSAAIESRNPEQILADLEQLDMKEYSPDKLKRQQQQQPSTGSLPVNIDLLYTEKRKRLKELFAKCVAHYEKEDPGRHAELKSLEVDYETKHKKILKEFEAVKKATQVNIDEVFLPPEPVEANDESRGSVIADPLTSNMIFMTPPPGGSTTTTTTTTVASHQQPRPPGHMINNQIRGHAPRSYGDRPQDQQANKRPRFIPSQARQYPPARKPAAESNTPVKPVAGSGAQQPPAPKPAAVIESKPVIFMPKATKFVPASVRAKVRPTPPTAARGPNTS